MGKPVTVTFEIEEGQVWIDRDGVGWRVDSVGTFEVTLSRVQSEPVRFHDLVRNYERGGRA